MRRIPLPSPFAIGAVNAYLLDGDPLTLVDPGPHMDETLAALEAGLAEHGRRVEDVELVLLTHQHHDHVGLAEEVRRRAGALVAGIAPLAAFLADFDASMDLDDAYAVALMRMHGVEAEVAETLDGLSRAYRRFAGSVAVERVLEPGERIEAGSRTLTVHARPGHSPTDTIFLDERDGLLIAGDHLLPSVSSNPVAHHPIGDGDPAAAAASPDRPRPLRDYLASLAATAALEAGVVAPGHGDPFSGHRELAERRTAMHERRARKILRAVDGERTAAEIGAGLWRAAPVSQRYLALSEVLGHLDLLAARGAVEEVRGADGIVRPALSGA